MLDNGGSDIWKLVKIDMLNWNMIDFISPMFYDTLIIIITIIIIAIIIAVSFLFCLCMCWCMCFVSYF